MHEARNMLNLAARHGLRGRGWVEPNPCVGCVIVKDGRIIGMGHHRRFGGPHAEVDALASCKRQGNDPRGATVYVTLEPCNASGRNPPCTQALLAAGVGRVVYAAADPNPAKGGGAAALMAAGIACEPSDASPFATALSAPFRKRITGGMPWVVAKWAQTIDGRVATRSGESKWISSEQSRRRVQRLRARVDGILTGSGTVAADDPLLTVRGVVARRTPKRIVADSDLSITLDSRLVRTAREAPTLVMTDKDFLAAEITRRKREALQRAGVVVDGAPMSQTGRGLDLKELLRRLYERHDCWTVMVEAGPGLLGSLLEADLIDEAVVYVAPLMLGDEMAAAVAAGRVAPVLGLARRFRLGRVRRIGDDVELTYERIGG